MTSRVHMLQHILVQTLGEGKSIKDRGTVNQYSVTSPTNGSERYRKALVLVQIT